MGLENPVHLLFIGVVALLVLGPRRLPELARALGKGIREFREAMSVESNAPSQPLQEPFQAQSAPAHEPREPPAANGHGAPAASPERPAPPERPGG
jgi:sec-independent protein translocase protein TatA